jgi:Ca-activated chloride channel homolog
MWITRPWWLLLLILAIPLVALEFGLLTRRGAKKPAGTRPGPASAFGLAPNGARGARVRASALLRAAAFSCVVLALAGTVLLLPSRARRIVLLFDTSSSVGPVETEAARVSALNLIGSLDGDDRVGIVSFAGKPRVLSGLVKPAEAAAALQAADLASPDPGSTDISSAMAAAGALLPGLGDDRIVLFSDGRPTAGGPVAEGSPARFAGRSPIPVTVVPEGKREGSVVSAGLSVPEVIHAGETLVAEWRAFADEATRVSIEVRIDGKRTKRISARLGSGGNAVPLRVEAGAEGIHLIELSVFSENGSPMPRAAVGAAMQVGGEANVLVAGTDPRPSPIVAALAVQGMKAEAIGVEGLPETPAGYVGRSAVVLDDVPALSLTETQLESLRSYVESGGGLLVSGGDSSFGRGEYYSTPLEEMLPVSTDTRQRLFFTRAKILFILDHSGSMSDDVNGVPKAEVAMRGIAAAVRELSPLDEVGIIAFDTAAVWILPFTYAGEAAKLRKSLSLSMEGGGTDMSVALREAILGFGPPGPTKRHAVILTDGLTQEADFKGLTGKLAAAGVSVTAIGVGDEVNEDLLKSIAGWGGGNYYRAKLGQIPMIIDREAARVSRDLIQEGSFTLKPASDSPLLEGVEGPPISGYLVVKAKGPAQVLLEAGGASSKDPILSVWRYGAGKVAAFASDSGKRWLSSWTGLAAYNRLWSQTIRSLETGRRTGGLVADARIEGPLVHLGVEAQGPDLAGLSGLRLTGFGTDDPSLAFTFSETAPGYYEARVPRTGSGLARFDVVDSDTGSRSSAWVWNPSNAEVSGTGPDETALGRIASSTGGEVAEPGSLAVPPPRGVPVPVALDSWLAALAVSLFLVELYLRSAGFGQLGSARAAVRLWWAARNREAAALRRVKPERPIVDSVDYDYRKVMDAYRYLAVRQQEKAGEETGGQGRDDEKSLDR